ncbi:MAG: aminotransferase class I/II-fold pyridoxal phosphate-dependent enzyme [Rhodospirillales bacterium]|nr:MAG: aminotransferase class I/II-fold pyridoxal phosphate-dependent enzyme [Rhodospirillales bacterium]
MPVTRREPIPPFMVMDMLRAANQRQAAGEAVIHLEVGQPSTGAPAAVLEAAQHALRNNRLGYTDSAGLPELRQAIAAHYWTAYGVDVDDSEVFVTTGSSAGFLLAFLSAFRPGDRVGLAAPGYPAYRNILTALGFRPVLIPVGPSSRYQIDVDMLCRGGPLKGLIIASPSNPTGSMIDADRLKDIYQWCALNDVTLISDEIYHGISFSEPAQTARAFGTDAIVINSFSKYFSMTGWRLGWMVLPPTLARAVECLAQNFHISPPALSQIAASAAFKSKAELDGHVARYRSNRDILLAGLPRAGIKTFAPPDGAFYLYADVSAFTRNSLEFCQKLLADTLIAAAPGIDFDPLSGSRFIRLSLAGTSQEMEEVVSRLCDWQGGLDRASRVRSTMGSGFHRKRSREITS